jgi:predicted aspartyl protease
VLDVVLAGPADPFAGVSGGALVDTGADISVIPDGTAARLALPSAGRAIVAGIDGVSDEVGTWHVIVRTPVGSFTIEAAEIGPELIVGRDVLNRVVLRFDGPALVLSSD